MNLLIAKFSYFCLVLIFALSACSLSSGPKVSSLNFPNLEPVDLVSISDDPKIYRLTESEAFFMALEQCSDQTPKLSIGVRQLFVGFTNLKINSQRTLSLNNRSTVLSLVSGELNSLPLDIVSYSLLRDNCMLDLVFWRSKDSDEMMASSDTPYDAVALKILNSFG